MTCDWLIRVFQIKPIRFHLVNQLNYYNTYDSIKIKLLSFSCSLLLSYEHWIIKLSVDCLLYTSLKSFDSSHTNSIFYKK